MDIRPVPNYPYRKVSRISLVEYTLPTTYPAETIRVNRQLYYLDSWNHRSCLYFIPAPATK